MAFTIDDASASFACVAETNFSGTNYTAWVRETRGAATNTLTDTALPFRTSGNGRVFTLFTGFDGAPKRPLDATAAGTSPTSVVVSWSDQSWDETSFQIERSTDGIAWNFLAAQPAGATSYNDTTATPGAQFRYRVRAANVTAVSAPGLTAPATTPTLFQFWLISFGLPADTNPQSDADRDGLSLWLEYALGGSPLTMDTARLPVAARGGASLTLTYHRTRPELTYVVETSTDLALGAWTSVGVDQGTPGPIVTASIPLASEPRRFLRLNVTGLP